MACVIASKEYVRVSPSTTKSGCGGGQRVAGLVQRGGQPGLADDVRGAARHLVGEELRGGQRRGPDGVLGDVDPGRGQACAQVPRA